MALISCPSCGKTISDKAKQCPHCGYSLGNENSQLQYGTASAQLSKWQLQLFYAIKILTVFLFLESVYSFLCSFAYQLYLKNIIETETYDKLFPPESWSIIFKYSSIILIALLILFIVPIKNRVYKSICILLLIGYTYFSLEISGIIPHNMRALSMISLLSYIILYISLAYYYKKSILSISFAILAILPIISITLVILGMVITDYRRHLVEWGTESGLVVSYLLILLLPKKTWGTFFQHTHN